MLGQASLGAWATYGLGTLNQDLPGFMVLVSGGNSPDAGKSVWGSAYLPGVYQGVQCRSAGDPILFVDNPPGMSREVRRRSLDALADLNHMQADEFGSPDTLARIEQYELAFRMQVSVPEVMDISRESPETLAMYGAAAGRRHRSPTIACSPAGWSSRACGSCSFTIGAGTATARASTTTWCISFPRSARRSTGRWRRSSRDLKLRGLLDETLVIWGGEFGRTSMMEARDGSTYLGRDHHPKAFTMLFAGGGMKPGLVYGETDEFGYFVTKERNDRPRPAGHDPAPPGPRRPQADVSVPWPRPAAHRPGRQGACITS